MVKRLLFGVLVVFFCSTAVAQNKKAELYYKNGRIQKGFAKILSEVESHNKKFFETGYVQFRETKKSKSILIRLKRLEKVRILEKGKVVTYEFLKIYNEGDAYKAMKLLEKGRVNLYEYDTRGSVHNLPIATNSLMPTPRGKSTNICVMRKDEEMATKLTRNSNFSNNFEDTAIYYFRDCPELVEKFKSKVFKKKDIQEAVLFYNSKCAEY